MIWVDYLIFAIIGASILVGIFRGFIKEAFSLAVWIAAFWAAFTFSDGVAELMTEGVTLPSARVAIAFIGIFLLTLLVGGLLNYLIGELVVKTGLSGTDRLFGSVFGGVRGLVLVLGLLIVANFTPLPNDPWWNNSTMVQRLLPLSEWLQRWLPTNIRRFLEQGEESAGITDDSEPELEDEQILED